MTRDEVINEYFDWLSGIVSKPKVSKRLSYRKLLVFLHNTEFRYTIDMDENRAEDGKDLRYRYARESGWPDVPDCLEGPCSVLEMMIALAIRCEEWIMDNTEYGNRTDQWFWGMVTSLGLGSMNDERFDKVCVGDIIERFLDREYKPNGKGGLFTINDCEDDLRDIEIWIQLCWYLDKFV